MHHYCVLLFVVVVVVVVVVVAAAAVLLLLLLLLLLVLHSSVAIAGVITIEKNMQTVKKNVKKRDLNVSYEGIILEKSKRVRCYISPRVSAVVLLFTYPH